MNLQFHPALKDIPLMSIEERAALAEDIKKNGQKYEILLLGGMIIDGRDRYLACKSLGIDPTIRRITNDNPGGLAKSLAIYRKHWPTKVRAEVAARLSGTVISVENVKGASNDAKLTQQEAADAMGVSRSSVTRANREMRPQTEKTITKENTTAQPQWEQMGVIRKLKEITTQISFMGEVKWVEFPAELFRRVDALKEQAERVAGLDMATGTLEL